MMTGMNGSIARWWSVLIGAVLLAGGCVSAPTSEDQILTDIRQLTFDYARAGEAYFSNDMNWIIFQGTPRGEQMYAMYLAPVRREGGEIVGIGPAMRISPPGTFNTCGAFSPDDRTIIFASNAGKVDPEEAASSYQRRGGSYSWTFFKGADIFRADGWPGAIAAADRSRGVDFARHRLTDNDYYDAECVFSPCGKWILFSSTRDDEPPPAPPATQPGELMGEVPPEVQRHRPNVELYVMRADGSWPKRLTNHPGYDGGAFFSPDGKRMVYRSDRQLNDLLQVYVSDVVYDSKGEITGLSNERKLTSEFVNFGPYWHPGGKSIIYATSRHGYGNFELYMMRDDGSRPMRITFSDGADVLPAFSPDGKYLLWCSNRTSDKTTQVFLAKFKIPEYIERR